jgi:hypothetical protein
MDDKPTNPISSSFSFLDKRNEVSLNPYQGHCWRNIDETSVKFSGRG